MHNKSKMVQKLFIVITCILAMQQTVRGEDELDGNAGFLNFSSRGLKDTLDLRSFTQLAEVDFSHNDLTTITWQHFAAPRLRNVDLMGNSLLNFPEFGPLEDIPLEVLNMSFCNIKIIPYNALHGLDLEILDVRENPIQFGETPAFDGLNTPPRLLIVSKITEAELRHICKNVDMLVEIIGTYTTKDCKNVRRNDENIERSSTREKMTKTAKTYDMQDVTVVDEMTDDTHLEMLADEPLEGSGLEDEITLTENKDMTDEKTISDDESIPISEIEQSNSAEQPTERNDEVKENTNTSTAEVDPFQSEEKTEIIDPSNDTSEQTVSNLDTMPRNDVLLTAIKDSPSDEEQPQINVNPNMPKVMPKSPLQRSEGVPVQLVAETEKPQTNEEDVEKDADIGENKTSTASSSSSKNVILVVIVGIVIVGSVFIAVKLYKDRRTYDVVQNEDPSEGREMQVIQPSENNPLIGGKIMDNANGILTDEQLTEVVVPPNQEEKNKTTKEILEDVENSGLPDIDDPNRLSTFIVSNTNIYPA